MERLKQTIDDLFRPMTINLFDFTNAEQEYEQAVNTVAVNDGPADEQPIMQENFQQSNTSSLSVLGDVKGDELKYAEPAKIQGSNASLPKKKEMSVVSLSSSCDSAVVNCFESETEDLENQQIDEVFSHPQAVKPISLIDYKEKTREPTESPVNAGKAMTIQQLWGAQDPTTQTSQSVLPLNVKNTDNPFILFLTPRRKQQTNMGLRLDSAVLAVITPALKRLNIVQLRPHQETILAQFARRRSVLASIPTSGGKSLIYTLPSVAFHSISVVVTPTIALREDQIKQLRAAGVNAVCIGRTGQGDTISSYDLNKIDECVLFLTPEKLCSDVRLQERLQQLVEQLRVCLFAIDECHLMLEWSAFRGDFTKLPGVLKQILRKTEIPVICLSASIPEDDCASILSMFAFTGMRSMAFDVYRDNMQIFLAYKKDSDDVRTGKFDQLENLRAHVEKYSEKLLVYARKTSECDRIARSLPRTLQYHSECGNQLRNAQEWQNSPKIQVLAATVGFGMGINVKQLNSVYIYDFPSSVNDYMQKIGRAGRNGQIGKSWFSWCAADFVSTIKIILLDRTADAPQRLQRLFALNLVLQRPVCQFASLQQYYVGSNLKRCGACTGCRLEQQKRYKKADIRTLSREVGQAFTQHSLLAIKQGIKSKGVATALADPQFQGLEPDNTALIVLCELVVTGSARIERRGNGLFLADVAPIETVYYFALW